MGSDGRWWSPSSPRHRKGAAGGAGNLLLKALACLLLAGVAFRLFCSFSSPSPGIHKGSPSADAPNNSMPKKLEVPRELGDISEKGKCNLFNGEWILNPSGPAYTNSSCRFIDDHQNCMMNGRPDMGYLYWRWKPYGCDLLPFDGVKFLDAMRDKNWGLIGDSILRNQAQSLICLLAKVEEPVEVYHDKEFKSRRWYFQSHNFTVSLLWAPFLIESEIFENENGESTSEIQLHLDTLDSSLTSQYDSFDYVIIAGGQWFLKAAVYWENGRAVGCHYCRNKNLTELGYEHLYRRTLRQVFSFIISTHHKPIAFFRTWAPDHFENGEWFNGGTCNRTVPYKKAEYKGGYTEHVMWGIELEEFNNALAMVNGSQNDGKLRLLDTYPLSSQRPDGHVSSYRKPHPFAAGNKNAAAIQKDCLHWCVPGPVDAWNDLIMKLVLD